jgi:ribonuclease R
VSVKILDRDRRGLVGEFHQLLVSDSVVDQAIRTTIAAMGIPDEWPDGVARAVAKLPKSVAGDRHPERRDLRDVPLVTIDGETAKDFDDAVYAEPAAEGWRLIVAIADVGHYVKPGSPLDQEAQLRGTSVYFPGFVVPMLPEALSNELCSLRPEVARLALVCDMRVAVDGDVVDHEFFEATIRSHARLTYNNVQDFFDGDAGDVSSAVAESLHTLLEVHRALRGARERRGGLDFETREGEIVIRDGRVCAVEPARRLSTHQLIEEAMIAANVAAAEFLEENESLSLYRVHEAPEVLKLDELRQALAVVGVQLPPGRADPKALQTALAGLAGQAHAWLYEQMVLRSMQQAVYSPVNQGHFGLALERYMHFTSPIRRYPDLLVHRAIKAVLKDKRDRRHLPDLDRLHLLGESCSHTERRAESAGWAVDAWLKCDLLQQRIGEVFEGLVAGVTDFGLFVDIEGYYVQGLLHVSELGNDYYHYNAQTASLIGEKSGRRFRLGDTLEVRVVDVDPPQGKIDLRLPVGDGGAARKRRTVKGRRG